jgi:predicted nucleotidyltransferase
MKKFINDLKKALKTEKIPGLAAVYLYGSLVRGIVRKDSDIDIAILPAPNLNKEEVLILISHVEDIISRTLFKSGIKRDISIVNMADKFASILLLFSIISQGTLIYEAKNLRQYRIEFQNMIIREYHDFAPYYLNEIKKRYQHA